MQRVAGWHLYGADDAAGGSGEDRIPVRDPGTPSSCGMRELQDSILNASRDTAEPKKIAAKKICKRLFFPFEKINGAPVVSSYVPRNHPEIPGPCHGTTGRPRGPRSIA